MRAIRVEPPALTLGELIVAVLELAGDEREGVALVARLLRSGAVRRRAPRFPG